MNSYSKPAVPLFVDPNGVARPLRNSDGQNFCVENSKQNPSGYIIYILLLRIAFARFVNELT